MKRLALALILLATPAVADTDKISLANLPACTAGNPISLWVLDSVDANTCDPEQLGTSDAHCCCANGAWASCAGSGSGGGGNLTLDLDADGGSDSTALAEIEIDNNIERLFAKEPSADILRLDAKAATDRYLSVGPSSLGTAGCEFDGSICSYTVVSGTASCAGTVDLYAATSGVEVCDISTRNGELLLQAGNGTGDDVFLKVDYTIPDGKGVLWKMSGATQGINNSSQCGVGVNNNDTSPQSGAWFEILLDAQSLGQRALMQSSVGTIGPASLADDVYEHLWGAIVRRDESTDHVYWAWVSVNGGTSWHYLGRSSHASTTMDNVWIYCDTRTAFTTNTPPVSIVSFDYIYEVDDNLFNPY